MNKVLKIRQTDDQKVYWVSDTHLNHDRDFVYEVRGFKSSQEHTDFIIDKINEIVRPNDILIHGGDFCLNTEESGCNELLARIQCQNIYLLWGNHPNPLRKIYEREVAKQFYTKGYTSQVLNVQTNQYEAGGAMELPVTNAEIYPFRYKNIIFIGDYAEVIVDGRYFVLSHYPLHSWNKMKNGTIHLFGHLHCNNSPDEGRRMDIGWDKNQRPYSTEEIWDIMSKKPIVSDGGHH